MIENKYFQFAAAPRTGTTWFMKACEDAGLGRGFKAHVHDPFPGRTGLCFRVSLIRHPIDWLASYFANIHGSNLGLLPLEVIRTLPTGDFEQFIQAYLDICPGEVGRIFVMYGADSYIKVEDFPNAFSELLAAFDLSKRTQRRCHLIPVCNQSRKEKPVWNPQLRAAVMAAEEKFMRDFEYL